MDGAPHERPSPGGPDRGPEDIRTSGGETMPDAMTDRERVELALKTEESGNGFYLDAAAKTDHKLARAAFEVLAKEEIRHVELIEALSRTLKGEGGPVETKSPEKKDLERSIKTVYEKAGDESVEGKMSPSEAYEKAIDLEKKIAALYFGYIEECQSDEARRLFKALYQEEQEHLSLLEDMYGYLTDPDRWFIDRDMVLLDGA
jgi:rubrerythrin